MMQLGSILVDEQFTRNNRHIWLTTFISLQPTSQVWIVYMVNIHYCVRLQKSTTEQTSRTNDVYELFTHVDTSNA